MNGQKRAEVWASARAGWYAGLCSTPLSDSDRAKPIADRLHMRRSTFPTHADALKWAIEQTRDTTGEQA